MKLQLAALAACLFLVPWGEAYFFESGYSHHYTFWSINTFAHNQNVTTILKFYISPVNQTEEGHRLHSLGVDSFVQMTHHGIALENPRNWDLSKTFLFTNDDVGTVKLVHCHHEDQEELLVIKKAIAGLFSVVVKIEEDKEEWHYTASENDHLGELEHTYRVRRSAAGLQLHRQHVSVKQVHRFHDKTMHYDRVGTLQKAQSTDRILLRDTRKSDKGSQTSWNGYDGTASNEFPDIETTGTIKVTLESKRPLAKPHPIFSNLQLDSLKVVKKEKQYTLLEVANEIEECLKCLKMALQTEHLNSTECVEELRETLQKLYPADLQKYATSVLHVQCETNDTFCQRKRLAVISIVGGIGTELAQQLLLDFVVHLPQPDTEELRRVFALCIHIQQPAKPLITAITNLCFGETGQHHGQPTMADLQSQACLAVGILARNLDRVGHTTQADQLVSQLETWSDLHSNGEHGRRSRRHANPLGEEYIDHHMTKGVLLHALGNAAMLRSKRHLLSHAEPNEGHHLWRRAALDSLRHYNCTESAEMLLRSIQTDEVMSVRQQALISFTMHPRRKQFVHDVENHILSQNYTYPSVVRVKRSAAADWVRVLYKGMIGHPRKDWSINLGSPQIGGSAGIVLENNIDLDMKSLEGTVAINVDDRIWLEGHIGLLNIQLDIFRFEVCYKRKLTYNTNIQKDMDMEFKRNKVQMFAGIAPELIQPLIDVINSLIKEYQNMSGTPISGFDDLADAVRSLPEEAKDALDAVHLLSEAGHRLTGQPQVGRVQQLATRAQALLEDVRNEATEMFANIGDSAMVVLPNAERTIRQVLNIVLNATTQIAQHPKQVFTVLEKAMLSYKQAFEQILVANQRIQWATAFYRGTQNSFLNQKDELQTIVSSLKPLISGLKAAISKANTTDTFSDSDRLLTDGLSDELQNASDILFTRVMVLAKDGDRVLQYGLDKANKYTFILKNHFDGFRTAIEKMKSIINAILGKKFDPKFPRKLRPVDDKCGPSWFPAGRSRYCRDGIEIYVNQNDRVVSPVSGILYDLGPGQWKAKLVPVGAEFSDYDIYISNIRLITGISTIIGVFVRAGQEIGYPIGPNGCNSSHIHLAMTVKGAGDNSCEYFIDPREFLEEVAPKPGWETTCLDYKITFMNVVLDFRKLTQGLQTILQDIHNTLVRVTSILMFPIEALIITPIDQAYITGPAVAFTHLAHKIVTLNPTLGGLTSFLTGGPLAVEHFFEEISMERYSLDVINSGGHNSTDADITYILEQLQGNISKAQSILQQPPTLQLPFMSMGILGKVIDIYTQGLGISPPLRFKRDTSPASNRTLNQALYTGPPVGPSSRPEFGLDENNLVATLNTDRASAMVTLKSLATQLCPSLSTSLSMFPGLLCLVDKDCLGLRCSLQVRHFARTDRFTLDIRLTHTDHTLNVTIGDQVGHIVHQELLVGNETRTVVPGITVFDGFSVRVRVKLHWLWSGDAGLTVVSTLCSSEICLPNVQVVNNAIFPPKQTPAPSRHKRVVDDFQAGIDLLHVLLPLPLPTTLKKMNDLDMSAAYALLVPYGGIQKEVRSSLSLALDPGEDEEVKDEDDEKPAWKPEWSFGVEFDPETGSIDLSVGVDFKHEAPFFKFESKQAGQFIVGGFLVVVKFEAGIALGVNCEFGFKPFDIEAELEIKPWASAYILGSLSLDFIIVEAGIRLTGYIMKVQNPLKITAAAKDLPLVITPSIRKILIPLELKLTLFVEVFFFLRIEDVIWHYAGVAIDMDAWTVEVQEKDMSGPSFAFTPARSRQHKDEISKWRQNRHQSRPRQSRSATLCSISCSANSTFPPISPGVHCYVQQIQGRPYNDPAYQLEFAASDDESGVQLSYAIGDYSGGTNVKDWQKLRSGSNLMIADNLPSGVHLYFQVKAVNQQGLVNIVQCTLDTLDRTPPDGRVDSPRCSSHRHKLQGDVVIFEDSKLLDDQLQHAVGYAPGSAGNQVVDWLPFNVSNTVPNPSATGDLRYFSSPRPGRLSSTPVRSTTATTPAACATECVRLPTCLTFSYHAYLYTCELQAVTEGANAERKEATHFEMYERLGKALTASLRYDNLPLHHGTRYYVNVDVTNVLGFHATLASEGTMVDFTSPEPVGMKEAKLDITVNDGCNASILQRCVNAEPSTLRHRKIEDGPGSQTVMNGNRKGQDMLYTMENYHMAGNWQIFLDEECNIHGYTWSVGTTVCGSDIVSPNDPHSSLPNLNDWPYVGLAKDLQLSDGQYFITVQAVSDIEYGGDLVTTVCHSTPFTVDTTPPYLNKVTEFLFDETFRYLAVYYDARDDISGVARMELGLGQTKYDVMLQAYQSLEMRGAGRNTYLVFEEFDTAVGVPAWIRLKVVNSVGMSAMGSSDWPILIDNTAPNAGHVLDGADYGRDVCCQNDITHICSQWADFFDPESSIDMYMLGVGTTPGQDDVVTFFNLTSYDKQRCVPVQLRHNVTYFSTIIAFNKALNTKSVNATSTGVLIDTTPPVAGFVVEGNDVNDDVDFTSETATITTSWRDFADPESGLDPYTLEVYVNDDLEQSFQGIEAETFTDHSFSFSHGDHVHVTLLAKNRAGSETPVTSDGLVVDHTPPQLLYITSKDGSNYQHYDDHLHFLWHFQDPESGIREYRCVVTETYQGVTNDNFYPGQSAYHQVTVNDSDTDAEREWSLTNVQLHNGGQYSMRVTAINKASMSTAQQSHIITVDTTPPHVLQLLLARKNEEEELNDQDQVEHMQGEQLWLTWSVLELESGVEESSVCIEELGFPQSCLHSQHVHKVSGTVTTTFFDDANLTVSSSDDKDNRTVYVARLVVTNGAGLQSSIASSKAFIVLKANVAGIVKDGRDEDDIDYSDDKTSIAITFSGFSSDACGIVGYEWAIGTSPFATDVLPYTDYGLVTDDDGFGFAQAHVMQFEGQAYYSSVRAKTGPGCSEQYIVSSSDGFVLDTTPPSVLFHFDVVSEVASVASQVTTQRLEVTSEDVVYQTSTAVLMVGWSVVDSSGVNQTFFTSDMFSASPIYQPASPHSANFTLAAGLLSGDSLFPSLLVTDHASNEALLPLPTVTFDFSPPNLVGLSCTKVVSAAAPLLECAWNTIAESHSQLSSIQFGLGSGPSLPDLHNFTSLPLHASSWTFDSRDVAVTSYLTQMYILILLANKAQLRSEVRVNVTYDTTPPTVESVKIVTSASDGYHDVEQQCQTSDDFMEVLVTGLKDDESNISSVEMALGSAAGRTDVAPFRHASQWQGLHVLGHLSLAKGNVVFVTVKVTNTVGLYTIASSSPVVISPEPRLEVKDGGGEEDLDGQPDLHVLQATWSFSDPCPVVKLEWSVQELGGPMVTNFTDVTNFTTIPSKSRQLYNDSVELENFKTYVNWVRLTDALQRTFMAFSDGVTVLIRQPDSAVVRDGLGELDIQYQEATDQLSANWDMFGDDQSTLPSDHILRYEVAVGTDRRYSSSRSDIHAFENVALATNVTFYGLNLTEKTTTYYITVRAYSAAGSYVDSSSDGVKVGYSADVIAGRVGSKRYQSSADRVRFWWSDFTSDMVIKQYYAAVGSVRPDIDNVTHDCPDLFTQAAQFFDISQPQELQDEAMAVLEGLNLHHNTVYYVTVIAADEMGQCSASISDGILVDTTPPLEGQTKADGYDIATAIFLHDRSSLTAQLDNLVDPESGVRDVKVELLVSTECQPAKYANTLTPISTVSAKNETTITLRDLMLEEDKLYFLRVTVTNNADLTTTSLSQPLLLDTAPPVTGQVKLGRNWLTKDANYQHETDSMLGLVALQSLTSSAGCTMQENVLGSNKWTPLGGVFSEHSVHMSETAATGLWAYVRHNRYLTGMEKGAAQFVEMTWREGNYSFTLSAGHGSHVLTGLTVGSPDLDPPFVPVNLSAISCLMDSSQCEQNGNSSESSLNPDSQYGLGLSFLDHNGSLVPLFWAQDRSKLKQFVLDLDFDPSASQHEYVFSLHKSSEAVGSSWDVTLMVDGTVHRSVSGMMFPEDVALTVYAWNMDDYLPPLGNIFTPFETSLHVLTAAIPLAERPLCSYGLPFRDAVSGIREVWAGVSDSANQTANVSPFTLIQRYCTPCLMHCINICADCHDDTLMDDYRLLPVELQGLLLESASDAVAAQNATSRSSNVTTNNSYADLMSYTLPTFYLDVRVMDQAGLSSVGKSPGLIVDTSPPIINFITIYDPAYSLSEPVTYVGNDHTVGVQWDTGEDVSRITQVTLSVGTRPATSDVAPDVHVDKVQGTHVFTHLTIVLLDGQVYFVTLTVFNDAGLSTKAWSNFTVHVAPPDMSVVTLTLPGVNVVNVSGIEIGLLDNTHRLEINLDLNPTSGKDVEYYEWSIGTAEGKDDVFPRTRVGTNSTKKMALVNGFMQLQGLPSGVSVGDFTKRNVSTDSQPDPTANTFNMEPGRCLRQKVYGVGKGHVLTPLDVIPTCVKRSRDVMVSGTGTEHQLWLVGDTLTSTDPASNNLRVTFKLKKGAMLAGALTDQDLDAQYGSSASTQFSPFIIRPDPTLDDTSRILTGRLEDTPGPHLFLSPVAEAELDGDVQIIYTLPSNLAVSPDSLPSLMIWNPEAKQWQMPSELCPNSAQDYNNVTRTITTFLCSQTFADTPTLERNTTVSPTNSRKKRSVFSTASSPPTSSTMTTSSFSLGPRMVTVAIIQSHIINQAPVIQTTSYNIMEDDISFTFTVAYSDADGDAMQFWLRGQPRHGTVNVSRDGEVFYTPDPNYFGLDEIAISGLEIPTSPAVTANWVNFTITLNVREVNDPPDIFYMPDESEPALRQEVNVGPSAGNGLNMTIYLEANRTSRVILGVIGFADVDKNDTIVFLNATRVHGGAFFEVLDVGSDDELLHNMTVTNGNSLDLMGKKVVLNIPEHFAGHLTFDARIKDSAGTFSMQLTLNVFVLFNPCIHGNCKVMTTGTCQEPQRAFTFNPYTCKCDIGYEGQWCEVDTDDCPRATCSPITDCMDQVGGYRCDPNPSKFAAIILCPIIAVILGIVVFLKMKKKDSKVNSSVYEDGDDLKKPRNVEICAEEAPPTDESLTTRTESEIACSVPSEDDPKPSTGAFKFLGDSLFQYRSTQNPARSPNAISSLGLPPLREELRGGKGQTSPTLDNVADGMKDGKVKTKSLKDKKKKNKGGNKNNKGSVMRVSFETPPPSMAGEDVEAGHDGVHEKAAHNMELKDVRMIPQHKPPQVTTVTLGDQEMPEVEV